MQKFYSEWIRDLNVRPKAIRLLQETGQKPHNSGVDRGLVNMSPMTQMGKRKK